MQKMINGTGTVPYNTIGIQSINISLPTDPACCPDINIEDVVLSNMIGEAAEKYCIYAVFSALGFKGFRILVLGFRV